MYDLSLYHLYSLDLNRSLHSKVHIDEVKLFCARGRQAGKWQEVWSDRHSVSLWLCWRKDKTITSANKAEHSYCYNSPLIRYPQWHAMAKALCIIHMSGSLSLSHTHTHTHTHTRNTHTTVHCSKACNSSFVSSTCTPSLEQTHPPAHTYAPDLIHVLPLSNAHSRSLPLSLSLSHTHTHAHPHTLTLLPGDCDRDGCWPIVWCPTVPCTACIHASTHSHAYKYTPTHD